MKKSLLIFGSTGSVGSFLTDGLGEHFEVFTAGRHKDAFWEFDFLNPENAKTPSVDKKFDAVIFCQGINPQKNLKEMLLADFNSMLQINLSAPAIALKQLLNQLNENASIIFFSSIAAQNGSYDPSYATAKAGIKGLQKSLSREFNQYRFNTIVLGLVENSRVFEQMTPDFVQRHRDNMYGGRLIQPEAILNTVFYLLNNEGINNTEVMLTGAK